MSSGSRDQRPEAEGAEGLPTALSRRLRDVANGFAFASRVYYF